MRYLILEGGKHLVSVVRPEWPEMRTWRRERNYRYTLA